MVGSNWIDLQMTRAQFQFQFQFQFKMGNSDSGRVVFVQASNKCIMHVS